MIDAIRRIVADSLGLKGSFFAENEERIILLAREICSAFERGGKVMLYGNGGSAADAQHIAAEFVGRYQLERAPLPAVALTTNSSTITSVANDFGYEEVFVRQIRALGKRGDVSIALSTSGNSPNVLSAVQVSREMDLVTVGLTGGDGGQLSKMVEHHLNVPHEAAARVQEVHIMIGHLLCELVEDNLKGCGRHV
jgi:D-sedoheptulose 7-phosphate isomerase